MRNKIAVLAAFIVASVAGFALAAPPTATGIWLDNSVDYRFTNCSATGSTAQVLPNGKYLMRVSKDEDVTLTFDPGFDGGAVNNRPFSANFGMLQSFFAADGGTPVQCASTGGTGDVYFTGTH